MKKLLLVLLIAIMLSACEEIANETSVDRDEDSETQEKSEKVDLTLTDGEAKKIAEEVFDSLVISVINDDYEGMKTLLDVPSLRDETGPEQLFEYMKSLISMNNNNTYENRDIEIIYVDENIFGASINEYTNLKSGTDIQTANFNMLLNLKNVEGVWKLSQSEENMNAYETFAIDIFGKDYVENGYFSTDPMYFFDNVYSHNVNAGIHSAKVNLDTQSVDVNIAISNGLDHDVYNLSFPKLVLYTGVNQPVPFADLSGYTLNSMDIIYSKDLLIIPLNIKVEDLLVPIEAIDKTAFFIDSRTFWKERD